MIRQQFRKMARRAIFFGLGLVMFSMVFLRTPNAFYTEVGENLVPVDPHAVAAMTGQSLYGNQSPGPYGRNSPGGSPSGGSYNRAPYYAPQNQGYSQYGPPPGPVYTQYSANPQHPPYTPPPYAPPPYTPPRQNSPYQPSNYQNPQEPMYSPRTQSNYQNRAGSAPADL